MISVILFVLGVIIGSFLNVLALRLNSGLSLGGRSHCPHCGKTLRYYELIPVVSFFLSGRRCRECRARISWQYPLVEIWTGLVFLSIFNPLWTPVQNFLMLATFSLFVAIAVYDFRHKIIPNSLVYPGIFLALVFRVLSGGGALDFWAGFILAGFFALIWLFSQGRAMGFGDAKLALAIGLLLGAEQGFSAIVLSFWLGAASGVVLMLWSRFHPLSKGSKHITIKSEIPFAPFIIFGSWLAAVFHLDLLHVTIF